MPWRTRIHGFHGGRRIAVRVNRCKPVVRRSARRQRAFAASTSESGTVDSAAREGLARRALSFSTADQTEVMVSYEDAALSRFTHDAIHQNVANHDVAVAVR